jgi:hypothetical protein
MESPKFVVSPHELQVRVPSTSGPNIFHIKVEPNDKMDDLKTKVSKIASYPVKDLHLLDSDSVVGSFANPRNYDVLDVAPLIDVEMPDKKTVKVPVLPTMTIGDFKNEIEDRTGVPSTRQRIFLMDNDGDELRNTEAMSMLNIEPEKGLELRYPEIQVRPPQGSLSPFFLSIDPHDDPIDTKTKIATIMGKRARDLHMFFKGDHISENHVFSHGDILDVATDVAMILPDQSKLMLGIHPSMYVTNVKDIIFDKTGIQKDEQNIFLLDDNCDPKELPNNVPLGELGVGPKSVLQLHPPQEEITINLPDGRSFIMLADPIIDSTDEIKRKVAVELDADAKNLKIFLNDDELDDKYKPSRHDVLDVASEVEVTLPNRQKTYISVLPSMTIEDVKGAIDDKTGFPKVNQRLFFLDNASDELQSRTLASKAGVNPGAALLVRPAEDLSIEVQLPDGRSFFLDMDPINESGESIRRKVAARLGISVKELPPIVIAGSEIPTDYRPSKGDVLAVDAPLIHIELPDKSKVQLAIMPAKRIGTVNDIAGHKAENGRSFTLIVDPDEPLKEVKENIRKKTKFPIGGLRIDGKVWEEDEECVTLHQAGGTRSGCVLAAEPPKMEIFLPNNKKMMLAVMPTMTVREGKKAVEEKFPDLSSEGQRGRMFFVDNDSELDDDIPFDKIEFDSGQKLEIRSMVLYVQHWDGRLFSIDAQSSWYIDDLRDSIGRLTKVLPEKQRLSFMGKPVIDDLQLSKQGIVHMSTLKLEKMCIRVRIPFKTELLVLCIEECDLVKDIIQQALKEFKLSLEDPVLVYGGIALVDSNTLGQCNIVHDDLLLLEEFSISVLLWNGKTCNLDGITQQDQVAKVKERILKEHDIPLKCQNLSLAGRRLTNASTLREVGVYHKAALVLEPVDEHMGLPGADKKALKQMKKKKFKSKGHDEILPVLPDWKRRIFFFDNEENYDAFIQLSILHWSGEKFTLKDIVLTMKTIELKKMIFKLKGIKKQRQKLKLNDILLEDKKSLLHQGVRHKSILTLDSPKKNKIATPDLERVFLNTLPAKLASEISITVNHWAGNSYHLNPDPHEYIDDIKDRLAHNLDIPVEYQRMIFQGQPTSDHLNLKEQGITDGSVLELVRMEVLVEIPLKKKPITVFVEPDLKIAKLKKTLAKKTKTPVEVQCIMFGGEELRDANTLSFYAIDHRDVLVLEAFKIRIMHWSGDPFELDGLNPNTTLQEVKEAIWRLRKVPIVKQNLVVKDKPLNDLISMKDQGVAHRAILLLQEKQDKRTRMDENVKTKMSFRFLNTARALDPMINTSFPLEIMLWDGKSFSIDVCAADYIDDIKDKIFSIEKIPLDYQLLQHKDKPVAFDLNLQDQDIGKGSCLSLVQVPVSVELPSGDIVDLRLSYYDTIKRAKHLLKKTSTIPVADQYLMLGGEELIDTMKVCDYGIDGDDTLQLETFTVRVADWDGYLIDVLGLFPGNGVEDLEKRISDMKGIPLEQLRLNFNRNRLNSSIALQNQGIKHRSIVIMEPPDDRSTSPAKQKMSFRFLSSALEDIKIDNTVTEPSVLCLHIKHGNGEMFLIKAEPSEYIEDVKDKIFSKKNIPVDRQRLSFGGVSLDDAKTLESLGIKDGSTLQLGLMEVHFQLQDGNIVTIEVNGEDTVLRLKRRLKDHAGISLENQYLRFGGQLLENAKKLACYGIDHGDSIELEEFKLCVADWTGNVFEVDGLFPFSNVSDVKEQIRKTKGIPPTRQSLSINGQKLNEVLRLKDQGLTHRAVLVLDTSDSSYCSILEEHTKLRSIEEEIDELEEMSFFATSSTHPLQPSVSKKKRKEGRHGKEGKTKVKKKKEKSVNGQVSETKKIKRKKKDTPGAFS